MLRKKYSLYVKPSKLKRQARERKFPLATLFLIATVIAVSMVFVSKVYLERRTMNMGMNWSNVHEELQTVRKAQVNLELELERYTDGDYIKPRAQAMGLEPARPGQVRMMWQDYLPVVADLN